MEQPPDNNTDETNGDTPEESERAPELQPRIYVASLADYNAGRLHGAWLDAARDPEELEADIAAMLAASPEPIAEDWAIHDYDGFGPPRLGEYENLETISRLATGIAAHGEAFAAWALLAGHDADTLARFEDAFLGVWQSAAAYAEDLITAVGALDFLDEAPEWLQPFVRIDYAGLARDLALSGNIQTVAVTDGVAIFEGG